MGKMSDWHIEMQEDALDMTREEWTEKHGESCIEIYNKTRAELDLGDQQFEFNFGIS
jgi:hypothetical protein